MKPQRSIELRHWFQTQHQSLQDNVFAIVRNFSGEIWSCDDFNKPCRFLVNNKKQKNIANKHQC